MRSSEPSKGARSCAAERGHRLAAALAGLALGLGGCGSHAASETTPTPSLSRSREAQAAFRPLRQRFVAEAGSERDRLEPALSAFVATFPKDGMVPLAKVYLALIAVHRGDLPRARELAETSTSGPSGTTKDLGVLVEGAILLRETCRAKRSSIFSRWSASSSTLTREYFSMNALSWRRSGRGGGTRRSLTWIFAFATPKRKIRGVRAKQMRRALDAVPHEALELMLQTMQRNPSATGYGPEIRKLVIARLAAVAIEQQDTELARRLVESTSSSSSLGDATEGLEELASSGGAPVVDGRMIGLLVSTGSSHLGGRAAEVLTGVVDAVRLTGDSTSDHVSTHHA